MHVHIYIYIYLFIYFYLFIHTYIHTYAFARPARTQREGAARQGGARGLPGCPGVQYNYMLIVIIYL